jgi:Asp-tRNA(Asn)/Glu-tRNA(Gln) amidotransferase B subunit
MSKANPKNKPPIQASRENRKEYVTPFVGFILMKNTRKRMNPRSDEEVVRDVLRYKKPAITHK